MTDIERYRAAVHAMQSGVAWKMNSGDSRETEPKHLRVGINSAMSNQGGLARLLIAKGVFTEEEYLKAIADQMEIEAKSYEVEAQTATGHTGLMFG